MEQAKKKPTKGHWPKYPGQFLDTVYPNGKPVDVYRYRHQGCGAPSYYIVTVQGPSLYGGRGDVTYFECTGLLKLKLEKANLSPVVEVCYREHLI